MTTTKGTAIIFQTGSQKIKTYGVLSFCLVGLAGCLAVETPGSTAAVDPQGAFLTVIGGLVLLATLSYAGLKAFLEFNEVREGNAIEGRVQLTGFVVGLLLTLLIIAADTSAPASASFSGLLSRFPWFILVIVGILAGFTVGLVSLVVANIRSTSGMELIILVLSFLSSTGLYLIAFDGTNRGSVLSGVVSVLIGLLLFRMFFPTQPREA